MGILERFQEICRLGNFPRLEDGQIRPVWFTDGGEIVLKGDIYSERRGLVLAAATRHANRIGATDAYLLAREGEELVLYYAIEWDDVQSRWRGNRDPYGTILHRSLILPDEPLYVQVSAPDRRSRRSPLAGRLLGVAA